MVSPRSSIGLISSKISSRPVVSGTESLPAALAAAVRAFQASLPTSQSKLSVWRARRSGTVSVSVILANESRDAVRPFLGDFLLDAERAAAKENNLRETRESHSVSVVEKALRSLSGPPRRYTRDLYLGAPADRDMTAWVVWERKDQL
jgi:hypothetical protein